ncbi:MAG TPA: succinate dehydrogenase, hydrophobic membrane anchor protein [Stellaceae bacterium]|jgi:succinate dehydrogenase / fumarate reductase membrane anchor subunit|nr:succinate dehydrogenase, hydrophobic membrane anchor protein [Stellaceae bacterium]
MAMTRMRSPVGRAIGLGSAKEGVEHWWRQRVSALALVPLTLWLVVAVIGLVGADHAHVVAWVRSPMPAVFLILLLIATFYHTALGLQVVIEDYIHGEAMRIGTLLVMRLLCILFAARGILAVLKMALGA